MAEFVRYPIVRMEVTVSLDTAPEPLYTGDKVMATPNDFDWMGTLTIKQDRPLPLTILAVVRKANVYGA